MQVKQVNIPGKKSCCGSKRYQAKEKFIGQIALAEENRMSLIISMAKSLLDFNCIDTLQQLFDKINAVTAEDLLAISNEIFDSNKMITLLFEPKE